MVCEAEFLNWRWVTGSDGFVDEVALVGGVDVGEGACEHLAEYGVALFISFSFSDSQYCVPRLCGGHMNVPCSLACFFFRTCFFLRISCGLSVLTT